MTDYLTGKPFSVPQRGRDPATCTHGWRDRRGYCVFCGHREPPPEPDAPWAGSESALNAFIQRMWINAGLHLLADAELQVWGRAGKGVTAWFRVRPKLATPKGRLP